MTKESGMHRRDVRHFGFTIVELLIVIGILALLMGMLLPALSGAVDRSRKQTELNALRQIGLAWNMYANSSKERALPGYLEADVQQRWNVTYEYPNRKAIPPAPDFSGGANTAGPWTWRLMPYLGYNHDTVHGHASEPEFDAVQMGGALIADLKEAAEIAYQPSFGYNAFYIGGWWQMETVGSASLPRYRFFDVRADVPIGEDIVNKRVDVVSRAVPTIRRTSEVLTFCSASVLPQGVFRKFTDNRPGWHIVVPPFVGPDPQWAYPGATLGGGGTGTGSIGAQVGGGTKVTAGSSDPSSLEVLGDLPNDVVPLGNGSAAPIGRYNRLVAILFADGHTGAETPGALFNMRRWIDTATSSNFRHD